MRILTSLVSAALLTVAASSQEPPVSRAAESPKTYRRLAVYPLATCIVSGDALPEGSPDFVVAGRRFRTCGEDCRAKLEKEPGAFVAKLDAALIAAQLPQYPLAHCPITGKVLGAMGEPVRLVLDDTLVQLCCAGCVPSAQARAAAIVEGLHDQAYAAQRAGYARKTCVISDHELGPDAVDVMVGTRLVRLCCEDCLDALAKSPQTALAALPPVVAREGARPAGATAASGCGTACVDQASGGGCCKSAAAEKPPVVTKPAGKTSCCQESKPVTATGCCDGAKPVVAPPKKID
ncbi:MAG: hypothetical protein IT457_20755 [Planctomycetes bacterium]|nr:hypothetical protein [Planctomycetota bacterium]